MFFTDFFDKYEQKESSKKENLGFKFEEKEKAALLKKYFKMYYSEDATMPTEIVKVPITGRQQNK